MAKNGECDVIEAREKMIEEWRSKEFNKHSNVTTPQNGSAFGAAPATEPMYNPYGYERKVLPNYVDEPSARPAPPAQEEEIYLGPLEIKAIAFAFGGVDISQMAVELGLGRNDMIDLVDGVYKKLID